jgi:hypothetical protein
VTLIINCFIVEHHEDFWIVSYRDRDIQECGNASIEGTEVCDRTLLRHETCVKQGFDGGKLACLEDCTDYDTSNCYEEEGPPVPPFTRRTDTYGMSDDELRDFLEGLGLTADQIENIVNNREDYACKILMNPLDGTTEFTFECTNESDEAQNITVTITVPKEIADTTSDVISVEEFTTLVADPVVQYTFTNVAPGEVFEAVFSVNKTMAPIDILKFPIPVVSAEPYVAPEEPPLPEEDLCEGVICNDGNPCTSDRCSEGFCSYTPVTAGRTCPGGTCQVGTCVPTPEAPPEEVAPLVLDTTMMAALVIIVLILVAGYYFYARKPKSKK